MVELNEKAVALAPSLERFGLDAVDLDMLARGDMLGSTGAKVFNALVALSALPAPDDGLVERLTVAADGVEKVSFDRRSLRRGYENILREATTALQSKDEQIERLTRERDEARENAKAVRGLLDYVEDSISRLERKWQFQMERTDAAEQQVQKLTAENERLEANIVRLTGNPVDHRYWEGRYRDERAENERLRVTLMAAREVLQEDRDELFDSVTVAGIAATMDEIDRPHVDLMDAILSSIDAALETQESGK